MENRATPGMGYTLMVTLSNYS